MRRAGGRDGRNKRWQKKFLDMARDAIALAEAEKLSFYLEWLKSITGVVAWVEREGFITDPQIRAIVNATAMVRKIVRWRKRKKGGMQDADHLGRGRDDGAPAPPA